MQTFQFNSAWKKIETSKQIRKILETRGNAKKTSRKFVRIPHVSSHSYHSIGAVSFVFLFLIQCLRFLE